MPKISEEGKIETDPYIKVKTQDTFLGVFDIEFTGPRRLRIENIRIVHWRMGPEGRFLYLIDEFGSVYNFANINTMQRIGD